MPLIVNADDWGRDPRTTDRTLDCVLHQTVSSVSAMVFMEDSERAAAITRERGIDAGLHLNFTTPFSGHVPAWLSQSQERLGVFLRGHRFAQAVFHPGLAGSFRSVVAAQCDEFLRLYGAAPQRVDGHHHMHLSANVLFADLLPAGTIARRNFSFQPGEKGAINRFYRAVTDRVLARRHSLADLFFSIQPLQPEARLQGIFSAARTHTVEMEVHPINEDEYRLLTGDSIFDQLGECELLDRYAVAPGVAN